MKRTIRHWICLFCITAISIVSVSFTSNAACYPNEQTLSEIRGINQSKVTLTLKKNTETDAAVLSLHAEIIGKKELQHFDLNDFYKANNRSKMSYKLIFKDLNHNGTQEAVLEINENGFGRLIILKLNSNGIKSICNESYETLDQKDNLLIISSYNYDYGMKCKDVYKLDKNDNLTIVSANLLEAGIRPGIDYDFYTSKFGKSEKKKYNTSETLKRLNLKQFTVHHKTVALTFQSILTQNKTSRYQLIKMETEESGDLTIGNVSVGGESGELNAYIMKQQNIGMPFCYSKFMLNETILKNNFGTVGQFTEVWKFKHKSNVITHISVELE